MLLLLAAAPHTKFQCTSSHVTDNVPFSTGPVPFSPPFLFRLCHSFSPLTAKTPGQDCHKKDYLSDQWWNWSETLLFISLQQSALLRNCVFSLSGSMHLAPLLFILHGRNTQAFHAFTVCFTSSCLNSITGLFTQLQVTCHDNFIFFW